MNSILQILCHIKPLCYEISSFKGLLDNDGHNLLFVYKTIMTEMNQISYDAFSPIQIFDILGINVDDHIQMDSHEFF